LAKAAKARDGNGASPLQTDLARQILARIAQDGLAAGAPVRELALARAFGVSRTPVRAALRLLQGLGHVALKPGYGFVLKRKIGGGGQEARLPRSPLDQLYDAIMADRARGELGMEVFEAELMPRYGVSRGALRRVLMKLADDGLVKRQRGHGWRFAEALDSATAVAESYRFRMIVECAGLREPTFTADREELDRLHEAHQRFLRGLGEIDPRHWFETNARFHETLAAWSGNRYLLEAMRRQNALRRLDEHTGFHRLSPRRIAQSSQEHIAILDAVAAGDLEWAATLLHRHLDLTRRGYGKPGDRPPMFQEVGVTGVATPARASIASAASRQRSSR
jgi:DNA-binding GntR family transcriptional regulator